MTNLKALLKAKYNTVPLESIYTHIKFLKKKNLISVTKEGNTRVFHKIDDDSQLSLIPSKRSPYYRKKWFCVLEYCQQHIGKRIVSRAVVAQCGNSNKDTAPLVALKRLEEAGVIQLIPNTSPYEYLVLPDIKPLTKIPGKIKTPSVVQPQKQQNTSMNNHNIANMTMGEILEDYMRLKVENERLREGLQRMGMEFLQLGILEHD